VLQPFEMLHSFRSWLAARPQEHVIGSRVADVGTRHVGIGLDYVFDTDSVDDLVGSSPGSFPPELGYGAGMRMIEPERITAIADALLGSGWSDTDLEGFLGANDLRVARTVWK
jgi:membrane dipeptidase